MRGKSGNILLCAKYGCVLLTQTSSDWKSDWIVSKLINFVTYRAEPLHGSFLHTCIICNVLECQRLPFGCNLQVTVKSMRGNIYVKMTRVTVQLGM